MSMLEKFDLRFGIYPWCLKLKKNWRYDLGPKLAFCFPYILLCHGDSPLLGASIHARSASVNELKSNMCQGKGCVVQNHLHHGGRGS